MDARWPDASATGEAREDVDADPRVAIAVGKTLYFAEYLAMEIGFDADHGGHTMKDLNFLQNWRITLEGRSSKRSRDEEIHTLFSSSQYHYRI